MDVAPVVGDGHRSWRHKALSAYYNNLVTLETYLQNVEGLLYYSDAEEYQDLVRKTICAPRSDRLPPIGVATGTQQEAIDRILDDLRGRPDVLLNGAKRQHNVETYRPAVQNLHAGSPSSVLRGKPWQVLRSRLGDAAFHHLLLHVTMFLPLGNNCYMQLCGPPIHDMYDQAKSSADPKRKRETSGLTSRKKSSGAAASNISRQRIYYGRPARTAQGRLLYGLPSKHVLSKAQPDEDPRSEQSIRASIDLLMAVFPSMRDPSVTGITPDPLDRVRGNRRRVENMLGPMYEILRRHKKMDYQALLKRCLLRLDDIDLQSYPELSVEQSRSMPWIPTPPGAPERRATAPLRPVSHSQVCRFLASALRELLPKYLVGGAESFEIIQANARLLVCSRTYEPISVHSLLQGIHVNSFEWLALGERPRVPPQEAVKRRQLVEQFLHWLFEDYLIPLLRASFYATETATTRYETVYYSHDSWDRATTPHLNKLQTSLLEELDASTQHLANGPLGACAVRLIPKPSGFRPIVNLGRSMTGEGLSTHSQKAVSANQVLRGVHQILTFEKNRRRHMLGSSLFGTNEVFAPLRDVKLELLKCHGKLPKLYFVKMDIKAAFDTINQEKVIQVVEQMLDRDYDYCLMLYCLLLPPASKASQASARRLFKTRAAVADHSLALFGKHAKAMAEPLRNAVIVDLYRRQEVTREACMSLLRTHIQQNVWRIGDKHFRQKTGIPQGSKISSLLCSFFYSFLEAEHLTWTRRPGTRLMRYIDDFLLITDDYGIARRFVHIMSKGFPEYGAFVSPSKTLLSFELAPGGQAAPVANIATGGSCYFPYCGFLIDTRTLDFSIDIDRLIAGPTRQSFALRSNRRRGANFVGWLSRQLENRNQVAFLDTQHNQRDTVYLNIFINFAHTAMKIPYYFNGKLDKRRAGLVYNWLCLAAEYTHSAGRARVRHSARGDAKEHFEVSRKAFIFLAKSAFALVLARRASMFVHVVDRLNRDLQGRETRGVAGRMGYIVDRGWPMLKRAKF